MISLYLLNLLGIVKKVLQLISMNKELVRRLRIIQHQMKILGWSGKLIKNRMSSISIRGLIGLIPLLGSLKPILIFDSKTLYHKIIGVTKPIISQLYQSRVKNMILLVEEN